MDWWQNLTNLKQIFLVVALGCFLIILAKVVMNIVQFYKIDNLNVERQEVEQYDQIANEDSDVEKKQPSYFSLVSINLLILLFIGAYFLLSTAISSSWVFVASAGVSVAGFLIFSYAKFLWRKKFKKHKN